jgi:hypothetical protein
MKKRKNMSENMDENTSGTKFPFIEPIDKKDLENVPKKDWVSITANNIVSLLVFVLGLGGIPLTIIGVISGVLSGDIIEGFTLSLKILAGLTTMGMMSGLLFGAIGNELKPIWETPFENTIDMLSDRICDRLKA